MCCGEYEMETLGLRPMTLLDFPGKVACTVFLAGCNFRCPYCHNPSLVYHMEDSSAYTIEEFFSFLERRKNILDGVCISGGEPMIHHNLDQFITRIREMGFQVKLDTNGSFPNRLESLLSRHLLDYVAMDVKNDRNGYGRTVGLPSYTPGEYTTEYRPPEKDTHSVRIQNHPGKRISRRDKPGQAGRMAGGVLRSSISRILLSQKLW